MYGELRNIDQSAADQCILEKTLKFIETFSPDDVFIAYKASLYFHALLENTYLFRNESTKEF